MPSQNVNLQDSFLNQVRKENTEVQVQLLNGASLRGTVRGFDNFTVIVHSEEEQHLIYKHAIARLVVPKGATGTKPRPKKKGSASTEKKKQVKKTEKNGADKFNALDLSSIDLENQPEENAPATEEQKDASGDPTPNA